MWSRKLRRMAVWDFRLISVGDFVRWATVVLAELGVTRSILKNRKVTRRFPDLPATVRGFIRHDRRSEIPDSIELLSQTLPRTFLKPYVYSRFTHAGLVVISGLVVVGADCWCIFDRRLMVMFAMIGRRSKRSRPIIFPYLSITSMHVKT